MDRWATRVVGFDLILLIGTVHTGTFDAAVDRNTRFGVHRSIAHELRRKGVQSGWVEESSTSLLCYFGASKNGQQLELPTRIRLESLPVFGFVVRYY